MIATRFGWRHCWFVGFLIVKPGGCLVWSREQRYFSAVSGCSRTGSDTKQNEFCVNRCTVRQGCALGEARSAWIAFFILLICTCDLLVVEGAWAGLTSSPEPGWLFLLSVSFLLAISSWQQMIGEEIPQPLLCQPLTTIQGVSYFTLWV